MESISRRTLIAFLLLIVFILGVHLRFSGLDWALHDGGSTPHPDERHVYFCLNHIHLEPVEPRGEDESLLDYWKRYWKHQLVEPRTHFQGSGPPLRPVNYNYGSFPFYCYKIVQAMTAQDCSSMTYPWVRFLIFVGFGLLIIRFCWSMRSVATRPGSYLKILPVCIAIPFLGLIALMMAPWVGINFEGIPPSHDLGIILIGRMVTALCGALTILLIYLIGRDAYGRWAGLLAAAFLAFAVLHIQLCHYATVDLILSFWIVVAIFAFHRVALKPRLVYYLLGAVATGFAVGTKWSAVTLPGILLLAHAIGTWGDEKHGQTGRWINSIWLLVSALILAHFFKAASSTEPRFNETLAAFRDFYLSHLWSLGILFIFLFALSVFLLYCQSWWRGDGKWGRSLWSLYRPWIFLVVAIPVGVAALFVAEPLAFLDAGAFANDVCVQHGIIVTGKAPMVFTRQYVGTTPIFYSLDNLFYPSLDWVTAFFGLLGTIFAVVMAIRYRNRSDLLFLAWLIPNFLLYSTFLCKFPRYLITVLPFYLLFGARLLVVMASIRPAFYSPALARWPMWAVRGARRVGVAGIPLAVLCAAVYGFAFTDIYQRPHTHRVAADWLREDGAVGKRIFSQSWDEWLPGIPKAGDLELHTDGDRILDKNLAMLAQADYVVLPSKRAYGTTFRLPKRFHLTNRLFRLLFSEQLGFELAATITSEPRIGFGHSAYRYPYGPGQTPEGISLYNLSWELSSDLEDESFRVYEHPKVVIFKKVKRLTAAQMRDAILNPPDWLEKVTWEDILCARAGEYIQEPEVKFPGLSWYFGLQVLSLCAFIFIFSACSTIPDRGYAFSKILGLILFAWISWLLASTGVFLLSRGQLICIFLTLIGLALALGYRRREALRSFWIENRRLIIGMEVLFLICWWIFLCIRAHHPDVYWGEKPMEFSFINAIYRATAFPPEDPWISGRPINYYYYGYVVYALLGRLLAIPPEYMFNLGVTTVPALLGLGVFGLIYNICRSWKAGVLGTYLTLFSGHLISYGRFIQSYRQWIEKDPAANPANFDSNTAYWVTYFPSVSDWFSYFPLALKTVTNLLLSALGLIERMPAEALRFLYIHQTSYFWKAGHDVIQGTAACEFPCWSFYFADFHPHIMVMPITVAALGFILAWLLRSRREENDVTNSYADYGTLVWFALVLGTVICTNTWDFPGLLLMFALTLLVRFLTLSPFVGNRIKKGPWISPRGGRVLAWDLLLPLVFVLFLSWAVYLPFHNNFTARVTGLRWMTEGNTPLLTLLTFFGVFLFPAVVFLLWRCLFPNGLNDLRKRRLLLFLLFVVLVFAAAEYVDRTNPFDYPPSHAHRHGWTVPSDYSSAAFLFVFLGLAIFPILRSRRPLTERYALLLGFLGLGILFGCEFVYVKEGWSEPEHRWNTVFKFYLQAWVYLALFASVAAALFWRELRARVSGVWRLIRPVLRFVYAIGMIGLLTASVVFPIAGGYSVTLTDTPDARGLIPSLDGLSYMKTYKPDEYRAIQFINYALDDVPVVLEAHAYGREYQEFGRVSMNTGCPTILGWGNHVRERLHGDEIPIRRQAVEEIYGTNSTERFQRVLGEYGVDYIYYGKLEREVSSGAEERWSRWGHILDVVAQFDLGSRHSRTTVYGVRGNLNAIGGVVSAETPMAKPLMEHEPGKSMFEGGRGFANGEFQEPRGLCVDSKKRVYVADTRNYRIQVFLSDGTYIGQLGERGNDVGQFEEPMDVAVDRADRVYVLDTWNHRVQVFTDKGEYVSTIERQFYGPRAIAIDPQTNVVYVSDSGHHVVNVFDRSGEFIGIIGNQSQQPGDAEGEFKGPVGIDVGADGRVVVADTFNDRIQVFDRSGRFLRAWPVGFTMEGERGIEAHLAIAPDGRVFVTDPLGARVFVFGPDGEKLGVSDRAGTGEQFRVPMGITLSPDGCLLVSDLGWNKILKLPLP